MPLIYKIAIQFAWNMMSGQEGTGDILDMGIAMAQAMGKSVEEVQLLTQSPYTEGGQIHTSSTSNNTPMRSLSEEELDDQIESSENPFSLRSMYFRKFKCKT
jgi:hypothetical protein